MRRGSDPVVILEDGKFIGINLSADFCAEHEWGFGKIKREFGVPATSTKKCYGLDALRTTNCPEDSLFYKEDNNITYLVYLSYICKNDNVESFERRLKPAWGEKDIVSAWDEQSFGIRVVGDEYRKHLKDLYQALKDKNAAMFLGGKSGLFGNSGLTIVIADNIPQEAVGQIDAAALSQMKLRKAADKLGIANELKKVGKRYFALSPRWKNESEKEIKFWLNPYEQQKYNSGWFTVEELREWVQDKGPVIKGSKK